MSGYELEDHRPYRANEHPPRAHATAVATVAREGKKHTVSPGSHRHKLLMCFHESGQRMTLIEAGQYALEHHGVGAGTAVLWDEGRRRASELAEFRLLDNTIGADGSSRYFMNDHGLKALRLCDDGQRWNSDDHDWGTDEQLGLL